MGHSKTAPCFKLTYLILFFNFLKQFLKFSFMSVFSYAAGLPWRCESVQNVSFSWGTAQWCSTSLANVRSVLSLSRSTEKKMPGKMFTFHVNADFQRQPEVAQGQAQGVRQMRPHPKMFRGLPFIGRHSAAAFTLLLITLKKTLRKGDLQSYSRKQQGMSLFPAS